MTSSFSTPMVFVLPSESDMSSIVTDVWSSLELPLTPASEPFDSQRTSASACVAISGGWTGFVRLDLTGPLPRNVAAAMFLDDPDDLLDDEVADAVGELVNMLGGNIKSLLPGASHLSLPTVALGSPALLRITGALVCRHLDLSCDGHALRVSLWEGISAPDAA